MVYLARNWQMKLLTEVVPELIGKWQDVVPNHFNFLDAFYGKPHRYAYTFQKYVFVTRVDVEKRVFYWSQASSIDGEKCF